MSLALVTGARGFIGRHLGRALSQKGIRVCGVGNGSWANSERLDWGFDYWVSGELTKSRLNDLARAIGTPDVVFHLAGGSSVSPSFASPEQDFRRSVLSTVELLEWARLSASSARLVFASSAAVYGAGHTHPIAETDSLAPYSPYGCHKRIAEELFESYGRNFGLSVASVRLFSVYGAELRKQLLWDVCSRLLKSPTRLTLAGSGNEVRDWIHVSDAVDLLQVAAASASNLGLTVNGGSGIPTTVRQVTAQICAAWGMEHQIDFMGNCRPGDPGYLAADTALSMSLGFAPRMGLKAGVDDYVAWFRADSKRGD